MKPEELLKPRFKVIADYPFNTHCMLGEVICLNSKNHNNSFTRYGDDFAWYEADFDSFPNIFRKLQWWEDRDEKDMPEYVKCDHEVFRVNKWKVYEQSLIGDTMYGAYNSDGLIAGAFYLLPATEEEFINQNTLQNQ